MKKTLTLAGSILLALSFTPPVHADTTIDTVYPVPYFDYHGLVYSSMLTQDYFVDALKNHNFGYNSFKLGDSTSKFKIGMQQEGMSYIYNKQARTYYTPDSMFYFTSKGRLDHMRSTFKDSGLTQAVIETVHGQPTAVKKMAKFTLSTYETGKGHYYTIGYKKVNGINVVTEFSYGRKAVKKAAAAL